MIPNIARLIPVLLALQISAFARADDNWVSLFNGKDLSGWKTTGNWIVQDDGQPNNIKFRNIRIREVNQ